MHRGRQLIIVFVLVLMAAGTYLIFNRSHAAADDDAKTVTWTSDTTADITITYSNTATPKKILWLGTLCNGHGLAGGSYEIQAMNKALKSYDIDYAFFGNPTEEKGSSSGTGIIDRTTYLTTISTNNVTSDFKNVTFTDYEQWTSTHSASAKRVYLVPTQKTSGSKTKGSNMGVTYLTQLRNDVPGTGSTPDIEDYAHIWGGYNESFVSNGWLPYYNADLQDIIEQATGNRPSVTGLHFTKNYVWADGAHANGLQFAQEINSKIPSTTTGTEYDFIVMSFDGLFEMANVQVITNAQGQTMRNAANRLQPYYNANKVIWLVGNSSTMSNTTPSYPVLTFANGYNDCNATNEYRDDYGCDALSGTAQTTYRNYYLTFNARYLGSTKGKDHSGNQNVDPWNAFTYLSESPIRYNYMQTVNEKTLGRGTDVPRFYWTRNMFQTMALFDPTTYRANTTTAGVATNTASLPAASAWTMNIGTHAAKYSQSSKIIENVMKELSTNSTRIEDVVATGLTPTGVDVYYYDEPTSSYIQLTSEDYTYTTTAVTGGTKVTIDITSLEAAASLKAVIHNNVTCSTTNYGGKSSNVGNAAVYLNDSSTAAKTYTSPTLAAKTFPITTNASTVVGGTVTATQNVTGGGSQTITYTPDAGYRLLSVTVDGDPVSISTYPSSYTFDSTNSNMCTSHTIDVAFEPILKPVMITKTVTGTGASTNQYFPIKVQVYKAGNYTVSGYTASASCGSSISNPSTATTTTAGGTTPTGTTFCLKDNQTITIADVPVTTKVVATETAVTGYGTSVKYINCPNGDSSVTTYNSNEANYICVRDGADSENTITFVNNKEQIIETGVFLDNKPYFIVMGIAIIGMILFGGTYYLFKKKKHEDEEELEII